MSCLRSIYLSRRRSPSLLTFLLLCLPTFFILLFISGHLEEIISYYLPVLYPAPTSLSSTPPSLHSVPSILISPPNACSISPFLLILVSTAPSHQEHRDAIRQTWGGHSHSSAILTLFVLGIPHSPEQQLALKQEAEFHGDIIQANFTDTYRNLTLKTLAGLAWASQKCNGTRYLLKADDDVYVNTVALTKFLHRQTGSLYLGRVHWRVSPKRNPESSHFVPVNLYEHSHFPPYCSGPGYVLSQDVARRLLQEVCRISVLSVEDVYIGILAWESGVAPQHSTKMAGSMAILPHGCCYTNMFTSHGITPRGMREAWSLLSGAETKWCPFSVLLCKAFGQEVEHRGSVI
ncbi:beta-1,3-galactosyltransferase 4-like isoform 1-T2 [Discoglossus pictus]